jgi:protein associated with RNAse G/E
MTKTWKSGDVVALRGIYNRRVSYMQSAVVVRDTPEEVALAILPGAECSAPLGYIHGKHGASGHWDRWGEYKRGDWEMQKYIWHTNQLLILLQPEKYYASYYFWQAANNQFLYYYVNFQLPFRRSPIGFDSFDLELDIIIEPTYEWRWKDVDDYQMGIEEGILCQEWVQAIDAAKQEVFERLEKRAYPFDGAWLNWHPNPRWIPPKSPKNWQTV